jgi:RND family efflux transporter MFP subunit
MNTRYVITAALFFVVVVSCSRKSINRQDAKESAEHEHSTAITLTGKQIQAVDIRLGNIEQKELTQVVRANGEIVLDPQEKAGVHALVGGIVKQILVTEGKQVTRGQTLAYLENTGIVELQKDYLIAQKETLVAGEEYKRQKDLYTGGAGVEKTFQQATANFEIAQARLTGLEKQLQQLSISPEQVSAGNMVTQIPVKAPIAGTTGKINISTGSYVDIQNPLMSISDNSLVHCDLKVFEKDIHLIRKGQEVDLSLTNQTGTSLKGQVDEWNKSFDNETKAITVHVTIRDKNGLQLMPGMYVTSLVHVGQHKTPAVPTDAIVSMEGKKYLFRLEDETLAGEETVYHFRPVEIITGLSELGYTQVTLMDELPEDATIVTGNAFYIASALAGGEEE